MRKAIILSLLTILTLGTRAADYEYLVFTLNDGTTQAVTATNLAISVGNDQLVVTDNNGTTLATFPLASLTKMEFSNDSTTDIHIVDRSALAIDENADIYDLQGRKVTREQMKRGVYVIKTKNGTHKVNVR